jgi:hypothetical protein
MDIQDLKKNGERFSSILYVDSAKRNRIFFPTPQQYEVKFNEPFQNVFSVQVLDASIPRTHYNVDIHNNYFCYALQDDVERCVYLDIGDYTDTELLEALNAKLYGISVDFLSSPSDRRKQFIFISETPFTVKPFRTTMRELLGFDQGSEQVLDSVNDPQYYLTHTVSSIGTSGIRVNVHSSDVVFYQKVLATETGKVGTISFYLHKTDPSLVETNVFDLKVRVVHIETDDEVAQQTVRSSDFDDLVTIDSWNHSGNVINGHHYVIVVSTLHATDVNYDVLVDIVSNSTQQLYVQQGVTIDFDISTFLDTTDNTINKYKFQNNQTVEEIYFGITTDTVGVNMGMQFTFTTTREVWSLIPPGIYNLLGDRYIVLRCKEIENHIMSSIKSFNSVNPDTNRFEEKQYDTGIAKFKMSVVGFREERFDFNTLPPQEFHPIGKLSSLTFAFENQDGILYDFKGVNHTITLSINYYKLKN